MKASALLLLLYFLPLASADEVLPDSVGPEAEEEPSPAASPQSSIPLLRYPPEEQRPQPSPWKKAFKSRRSPPKMDPDLIVQLPGAPGEGKGGSGGGRVLGLRWVSSAKNKFRAFLKVPYAQPPLGPLRFLPPRPALPWEGVRHRRVQDLSPCAQMDFNMEVKGVEDCLYLNVYTPMPAKGDCPAGDNVTLGADASSPPSRLYPVMVWIHGGGFFAGTGNPDLYGPEHLMDEDVVLVTFNYRLGPVGFLTFENELAPGNLGLRDQVAALTWVRDNIAVFGGDPSKVTVFGESAGSMSVMYLLVSPLARGLFHGAIAQSGPFVSSYTHWDKRPKLYARRYAAALNCTAASAFANSSVSAAGDATTFSNAFSGAERVCDGDRQPCEVHSPRSSSTSTSWLGQTLLRSALGWAGIDATRQRRAEAERADLEETRALLACLREVPVLTLAQNMPIFFHYPWTGPNVWKPHVDGHHAREEQSVLPEDPYQLLLRGKYHRVPLVIGANSDEGILNVIGYLNGQSKLEEVEDMWEQLGPLILFHRSLDETTEQDVRLAKQIKRHYFGSTALPKAPFKRLIQLMGDHCFYGGIELTVKGILAHADHPPVYQYIYNHMGSFTIVDGFLLPPWKILMKSLSKYIGLDLFNRNLGVGHADELFLLFKPHEIPFSTLGSDDDRLVSRRIIKYWTNFAKYHDPNPPAGDDEAAEMAARAALLGCELEKQTSSPECQQLLRQPPVDLIRWEPVSERDRRYLNITSRELRLELDEEWAARFSLWADIMEHVRKYRRFLSDKPPLLETEVASMLKKRSGAVPTMKDQADKRQDKKEERGEGGEEDGDDEDVGTTFKG